MQDSPHYLEAFFQSMQSKISSRFLTGGVLITVSTILIFASSWFFWWKYTAPPNLAKILPANQTLLFVELHPNNTSNAWQNLQKNFTGQDPTKLFELDSLGITESQRLWKLARNRIGVGFLGEKLDPQRFVLLMDSENPRLVLQYLQSQSFLSEKIKSKKYLGEEIFTYPNSHSFAFTFRGNDLILATNLSDLKSVIAVSHGKAAAIAATPDYRTALTKLDPRGLGFGYFSSEFVNQLITARLGGMQNALATPLLNLWQSGGFNLTASESSIKFSTHFILKDEFARNPLLLKSKKFNPAVLGLLNAEVEKFWLVENGVAQLHHFLTATKEINPSFSMLAHGSSAAIIKRWLGDTVTIQDLEPLFVATSVVGVTQSGSFIGIFPKTATNALQQKILNGKGLLSAEEKTIELPDTTSSFVLTSTIATANVENLNGYSVTKLKFPQHELNFVDADVFTIIASDSNLLTKILTNFEARETGLAALLTESNFSTGNLYYSRLPETEIALLKPFHFTLANLQTSDDDLMLDVLLGK